MRPRRRNVERRAVGEEAGGSQGEADPLDRHDRPVLRADAVGGGLGVDHRGRRRDAGSPRASAPSARKAATRASRHSRRMPGAVRDGPWARLGRVGAGTVCRFAHLDAFSSEDVGRTATTPHSGSGFLIAPSPRRSVGDAEGDGRSDVGSLGVAGRRGVVSTDAATGSPWAAHGPLVPAPRPTMTSARSRRRRSRSSAGSASSIARPPGTYPAGTDRVRAIQPSPSCPPIPPALETSETDDTHRRPLRRGNDLVQVGLLDGGRRPPRRR